MPIYNILGHVVMHQFYWWKLKYLKIHLLIVIYMGESSKFPKSWTLEILIFKHMGCLQKLLISGLSG